MADPDLSSRKRRQHMDWNHWMAIVSLFSPKMTPAIVLLLLSIIRLAPLQIFVEDSLAPFYAGATACVPPVITKESPSPKCRNSSLVNRLLSQLLLPRYSRSE
jgi:hypothetical protein